MVLATTPEAQPALAEPAPIEAKAPEPPAKPFLKIGLGMRTGLSLNTVKPDGGDSETEITLNDGVLDQITLRPYMSANLTDKISLVANFDVETSTGLNILDAMVQVKFFDELQLWLGQHIPANARNNFCGPFFHNSWNFNLVAHTYPMDFAARDRGFTFWGIIAGGILKYHASMVDLQPGRSIENARYAGRLTLNLLDPENYYYASGTYFGAQDTLALGAVVSYQKGLRQNITGDDDMVIGTTKDNDFVGFSFDALFEKNLGTGGTITLEAGYLNFDNTGKFYVVNQATNAAAPYAFAGPIAGNTFYGNVSWLAPSKLGIGQLQPNAQFQFADKDAGDVKMLDVGLAYIVDGWNHKWHLNFRHGDMATAKQNALQLGVQIQI